MVGKGYQRHLSPLDIEECESNVRASREELSNTEQSKRPAFKRGFCFIWRNLTVSKNVSESVKTRLFESPGVGLISLKNQVDCLR